MSTTSHEELQSQLKLIRTKSGAVRISQACDRCRIKKIKCDGSLPCNNCAKGGFNCSISDKLARRSFPKGYTENLERNIKALETENNDLLLKLEDLKQQLQASGASREASLSDAIQALSNTSTTAVAAAGATPIATAVTQSGSSGHTHSNFIINEKEVKIINCEKFRSLPNKFNELLAALNLQNLIALVEPSVSTFSRTLDQAMENFKLDDYLFKILSQVPAYAQSDPSDINHRSTVRLAKMSEIFDNKLKLDHVLLNYFHHYNSLIPILTFKNFLPHYLKFINKLTGVKQKALLVSQSQADPSHIRYALRLELIQLIKDYKLVIVQILMITKITLLLNPLQLEDDVVHPLVLCLSFNNVCRMSLNSVTIQLLLVHYAIINNDQTSSFKVLHLLDSFVTSNSYTSIYNVQGLSPLSVHPSIYNVQGLSAQNIQTSAGVPPPLAPAQPLQSVWDNKIRLKIIWSLKILTQIYRLKFGHAVSIAGGGGDTTSIPKLNSFVKDNKLVPTNLFQDLVFTIREPLNLATLDDLDRVNLALEGWRSGIKHHQSNYYHEFGDGPPQARHSATSSPDAVLSQTTNLEKSMINYQLSIFYFTLRSETYLPFFINTLVSGATRDPAPKLKYEHFVALAFVSEQFLMYALFVFDKKNYADYSPGYAGDEAPLSANMILSNLCTLVDFPKHVVMNCFYLIYCCLLIFKPNTKHHNRLSRCLGLLRAVCALFSDNSRVADLVRSAPGYDAAKIRDTIVCILSEARVLGEGVADAAEPSREPKRFKAANPCEPPEGDFYSDTASLVSSANAPPEWGLHMSRQNSNASTTAEPSFEEFEHGTRANAAFAREGPAYTGHAHASQSQRLRQEERGKRKPEAPEPAGQPSYEILFNWSSNLENLKDDYMFTHHSQGPEAKTPANEGFPGSRYSDKSFPTDFPSEYSEGSLAKDSFLATDYGAAAYPQSQGFLDAGGYSTYAPSQDTTGYNEGATPF